MHLNMKQININIYFRVSSLILIGCNSCHFYPNKKLRNLCQDRGLWCNFVRRRIAQNNIYVTQMILTTNCYRENRRKLFIYCNLYYILYLFYGANTVSLVLVWLINHQVQGTSPHGVLMQICFTTNHYIL